MSNYTTLNIRPNEIIAESAAARLGVGEQFLFEPTRTEMKQWKGMKPRYYLRDHAETRVGYRLGDLNDLIPRIKLHQYGDLPVIEDTLFNLWVAQQPEPPRHQRDLRKYEYEPFDFAEIGTSEDHIVTREAAQEITGYSFAPHVRKGETNGYKISPRTEVHAIRREWVESACAGEQQGLIDFLRAKADKLRGYNGVPEATEHNAELRARMQRLARRGTAARSPERAREQYEALAG